MDQTTIINKDKPGGCPKIMIFVMTLMWCGHNLLRQKKAHRNVRDMNGMKAKHDWFAIGIGKGPVDKTRANNVQPTTDSSEHALMQGSVCVWFKVIDVVGASN